MVISLYYGLKSYYLLKSFDSEEIKTLKRFNGVHHTLTFFFLLGYIAVATAIGTQTDVIGDLFVGVIFLFGAIFVFLGIRLQAAMNAMLQSRYKMAQNAVTALEQEQATLVETNRLLETEIIEREQAETIAREREARIGQILSSLPIGILIVDAQNLTITDVNPAAEAMIGTTKEQIVGHPCHKFICDADKKSCPMQVSGNSTHQDEHCISCTDGNKLPILKTVSRIDLEGIPHFLEAFINIEEKKALEEKLQRSQRMEVIGTLAGSVAHDLNNILSGVINYPELMLMTIADDDPMRKPLETIKRSGQRAATIVQDLLTLARQNVAINEPVNLSDVILDYMNSPEYEHLCNRHPEVTFTFDDKSESSAIEGSPVHLGKMVMNLATNSAEAISLKGSIQFKLENRYIDTPLEGYENINEGEYVLLTVRDNGIGIAPENLTRIFEPFYTNKVLGQSGSGLGMPVVWNTIKEHNGYIQVKSEEGVGTTFMIYLPTTGQTVIPEEMREAIDIPQGNGQNILVVDDLEVQREIASSLLTHLGYNVQTAKGGEAAIEMLATSQFDLILLDMIMEPGIDGLETYNRILKQYPRQKVMLVSGFAGADRVEKMRALGLNSYIKKPYTLHGLAESVEAVLQ